VPIGCTEQTGELSTGGDDRANSGTGPANEPPGVRLPLLLGCGRFGAEPAQDQKRCEQPGSQHCLDTTLGVTPETSGRRLYASDRPSPADTISCRRTARSRPGRGDPESAIDLRYRTPGEAFPNWWSASHQHGLGGGSVAPMVAVVRRRPRAPT